MNVCLILPPRLILKGYRPPDAHPPLGLALIAASLRKSGYNVIAIDAIAEASEQTNELFFNINSNKLPKDKELLTLGLSPKEIADRIPTNTKVIGISCMFSFNWIADRELVNYLKRRFPLALFIAGGESISGMPEECLKQCKALDICAIGEGEETIIEVLKVLENKTNFSQINGIVFRAEDGSLIKTNKRNRIKSLEDLPFPAWELFPIKNYHKLKTGSTPEVSLPLIATRGCPYSCTFCTSPDMWGTRYYMRSPEHVIKEIEYLKKEFNATIIEFFDLTAIVKKEWIMKFTGLLLEKNINIHWRIPAGTRSEAIDGEVARNLKKSGCYFITYAPESGSARLLKIIKKKVKLENLLQSIRYSKQEGMRITINMIMGLPDETHLDIWKTMWFLVKCKWNGVDSLPLHIFRPYPGSALFERVLNDKKIQLDNDDYLVDSLLIIQTNWDNTIYNDNVGKIWYKIYHTLIFILFYGTGYIIKPSTIIKSVKNITTKNYENDFETKMSFIYEKLKNEVFKKYSRSLIIYKNFRQPNLK
ncbi:MAG: radical SAM protein [Bacteroidia bacterium]